MAHRTNVIQVLDSVEGSGRSEGTQEKVMDPVCHVELDRHAARYMLGRADRMYYFCSPGCRDQFVRNPGTYAQAS